MQLANKFPTGFKQREALLEEVDVKQNHQGNQAEKEGVCLLLALKDYCTLPEQLGADDRQKSGSKKNEYQRAYRPELEITPIKRLNPALDLLRDLI